MKGTILRIAGIVLGVGALGAGGYFGYKWWKKRKSEGNEPNVALEVEFISDADYRSREEKHAVRDEDDSVSKPTDIRKETLSKAISTYGQPMSDAEREDFEAYLAGLESPEEDDEDEEDDDEHDIHRGEDGPYRITAGEFCNTRTYYDKVSVNYFADDGLVADDRDEVMENAQRILGDLQAAFNGAGAPSVLYIRNEALEVDYEVSFVDGRFRMEGRG